MTRYLSCGCRVEDDGTFSLVCDACGRELARQQANVDYQKSRSLEERLAALENKQ